MQVSQYTSDKLAFDNPNRSSGEEVTSGNASNDRKDSVQKLAHLGGHEEKRDAASVAYETLNEPGRDFFLHSQTFISKIASISYDIPMYSTLEAQFELMKAGRIVSADLHDLWNSRPLTVDLVEGPRRLENILQPQLAQRLVMNLRIYTAYFFAQLIDLHRCAFAGYPAERDVQNAITQIIRLAREILNDTVQRHTSYEDSQSNVSSGSGAGSTDDFAQPDRTHAAPAAMVRFPPMMLWPLFLAATEASLSDRTWILQVFGMVDKRSCPTAAQTTMLLEEVLRRQDETGVRVDHHVVRRDIFDNELSVVF